MEPPATYSAWRRLVGPAIPFVRALCVDTDGVMGDPVVSVIIPTFNSVGTLRESLRTALWQTFEHYEVIVVGDGCTDETEAVVTGISDDRVRWLGLPTNSGGPSKPRNHALAVARGRLVAYLGHDDLWFPDHLLLLISAMRDRAIDIVSTTGVLVEPSGDHWLFSLPDGVHGSGISPSTWMHRWPLRAPFGLWPEDLDTADDRSFLASMRSAGLSEHVVAEISVVKFPSSSWGLYGASPDPPLKRWSEMIESGPDVLRSQLAESARPLRERRTRLAPLVRLVEAYGVDRWPVRPVLRAIGRRRRGLG